MNEGQKHALVIGAGALGVLLLYRYEHNNAAAQTAGTQTGGADPSAASSYAALAGQEQSDAAGLQQQNQQLLAQEQSDVATLTGANQQLVSDFGAYQASEQADVASLTAQIQASIAAAADAAKSALGPRLNTITGNVSKIASGEQAVSRATTITTHKGGGFYKWYQSIYKKAPPSVINNANPIFVAYQHGVSKATVKKQNPRGILH